MNNEEILKTISDAKILPVIRAPTVDLARSATLALASGGIRVFEITLTIPDAPRLIEELCAYNLSQKGAPSLIGAGTVLSADDALRCIESGAQFIVSPGLDREMISLCKRRSVPVFPGALTPTEVISAHRAGADMVKIFPCSAMGGASYLRALKAPLPHVKLLPTGGVVLDNMLDYLAAGASAVGVGTDLVNLGLLEMEGPEALTARARRFVEALESSPLDG
jgi:2-dehydro-3-deoxyphosphogluconate aldolase/(4S)-4-hydroxy-2-oxoglutarate aldolase